MRKELQKVENKRGIFFAEFSKYGTKSTYKQHTLKTMLLINVLFQDNSFATDHIWFTVGKTIDSLGELNEGDKIQFEARVTRYVKGYHGQRSVDFRLSHPTKIKKIT